MKLAKYLFSFLFVLCAYSIGNTQGFISLSSVDGEIAPDTLATDQLINFNIHLENGYPDNVTEFIHKFQVTSRDGAFWNATSGKFLGNIISFYDLMNIDNSNTTGSGTDIITFSGLAGQLTFGLPPGFKEVVWQITIGPISSDFHGRTICLDSSMAVEGESWLWSIDFQFPPESPAWDGEHCFTIVDVNQLNKPPVFTSSVYDFQTDEGKLAAIPILATDPDQDFVTLTLGSNNFPPEAFLEQLPTNSGFAELIWLTDFEDSGFYSAEIIADDGKGGIATATYTLIVNDVNQAPVLDRIEDQFVFENDTLRFLVTASDIDDDAISMNVDFGLQNYEFIQVSTKTSFQTYQFTVVPTFDDSGIYTATFYASDEDLEDTQTVNIRVFNTNRQPVVLTSNDTTINEGQTLQYVISAVDPDGDSITYFVETDNLPSSYFFEDSGNGKALLEWTPTFDDAGQYELLIYADDNLGQSVDINFFITVNNINRPPELNDISDFFRAEGDTVAFPVIAFDPDFDSLVYSLLRHNLPASAVLIDSGFGAAIFDWPTTIGDAGTYYAIFNVDDLAGGTDMDSVNFLITSANSAPEITFLDDVQLTETDTINYLVSATDLDNDQLTLSVLDSDVPSYLFTDSGNGTGSFYWETGYEDEGTYFVTLLAEDPSQASDTFTFQIFVMNNPRPPVLDLIGDKLVNEGDSLYFTVTGTDPDDAATRIEMITSNLPNNATFGDPDYGANSFYWQTSFVDSGTYSATFVIYDADSLTDSETIAIIVNDVNRAPVITTINDTTINENQQLVIIVTANDDDGDLLSLEFDSGDLIPLDSFVDNGDNTGTFSWTPTFDEAGNYTILFSALDGRSSFDQDTVEITVLDANRPLTLTLVPPGDQFVNENDLLYFEFFADDPDGGNYYVFTSTLPGGANFSSEGSFGSIDWTPTFDEAGQYPVTIFATNDIDTVFEDITITVYNVNRPPVLNTIGTQDFTEGTRKIFVIDASDPDVTIPVVTARDLPIGASLEYGDAAYVDWTPGFDQAGVYFVTFFATDDQNAVDSEVVLFSVSNVNQPPSIEPLADTMYVTENNLISIDVFATDPDGDCFGLGFSSPDLPVEAEFFANECGDFGNLFWETDFDDAGSYTAYFIANDGEFADTEQVTIIVLEQPCSDLQVASFGLDGPQQISINREVQMRLNVELQNFGPLAVDSPFTLSFYLSDTPELDGVNEQHLGLESIPSLAVGGPFAIDLNSPLLIDYDQILGMYFLILSIDQNQNFADCNPVNNYFSIPFELVNNIFPVLDPIGAKPPVDEGQTISFGLSGSDFDSDPLSYEYFSTPPLPSSPNFVDSGNGSAYFEWTPGFTDAGVYSVTFVLYDNIVKSGGSSDQETVVITVNNVNRPPVLASIGFRATGENVNLNFNISATDADGTTPALTTSTLPSGASFIDNGNGTGTFNWTPTFVQAGNYEIVFRASDGVLVDTERIVITVFENGNQAPILATIGNRSVTENVNLNFNISATDPDGSTPSFSTSTLPTGATFINNGNGTGTFNWTPGFDQAGIYEVTFYASDEFEAVDSEVVTITVADVACSDLTVSSFTLDGPQQISYGRNIDTRLNLTIDNLGPLNVDSQVTLNFYYSVTPNLFSQNVILLGSQTLSSVGGGSTIINVTGPVTMVDTIYSGLAYVIVEIAPGSYVDCDPSNNIGSIPFEMIYDLEPSIDPIGNKLVNEGETLSFFVFGRDGDNDQLEFEFFYNSEFNSTPTLIDSGFNTAYFEWTPSFDDAGIYIFEFFSYDGYDASPGYDQITITVNNVNRPPVLNDIGPKFFTENTYGEFDVFGFDPDEDGFTVTSSALPVGAIFTASSGGMTFYWTPEYDQAGVYPVTFYITDDSGLVDSELVNITVNELLCPDFSIEVFSLDGPQQISFDRFIQNRLSLEIQNSGEIDINGEVAIEFFVSDDSNIANCDCNVEPVGFELVSSVPVGNQFEVTISNDVFLSIESSISEGNNWLCAVIDEDNIHGDCEMDNNYFCIPINVDYNIPPILDPIGDKEVNEGDTLGFVVSAIDWDFDEIYLDYYVDNNCECIDVNFEDSGNGHASFEWAPGFNLAGDYAFEFYAYDNYKTSDQENITIKVNNTNRAPDIDTLPDTLVFNEGDKIGFRVFASDPDDDCFELALESTDLPPSAVFDYVFDCVDYGDFDWVPGFGDAGIYHAIFVVTDEFGGRGEEEMVLVINNINGPPQFDEIPFQFVNENETFDFQISATDIDGTIPSISTDQLPVGASFVDNGNGTGTFNWATDCSQSGEYSIRCYAADDSGLVDTSFIYLEVGEACDLQLTVVTSPCVQCSPPLAFTDILVSDNGFAIEFNKYLDEGSISENISISSVRGDELYYQYDIKNKSIIIRSEFGEFVPIDTIFVTLSTGIYDLDESSLDSNYNLTYTVGPVVYPGDCNNDGVVNEVDVLWIGIYWNQDGPDRFVGGEYGPLEFFAQPAHFQEQGNGEWENRNAVYADVDGSGMIDAFDLCGVAINFAKNSYEDVLPKGSDASTGTASMGGLNSKVLEEMRLALIECPESAPKARILEAIENALRASTANLPTEIELHQNYPNPFNPSTTIEFYLPKAENTTLSIYNMLGQEVITLLDEKVEAGYKEVVWSGKDKTGHQVASGIYFYKLNTETKEIIKRMLLVK